MNPRQQKYQKRPPSRFSPLSAAMLIALLVFPALACVRIARLTQWQFVAGYLVFILALTFVAYWHDKRSAVSNAWRTPESTLHLAELLGGWPSAFLAQRLLRHKTSKPSYQAMFWAIVVLHEAASFDFLQDWRYVQTALRWLP